MKAALKTADGRFEIREVPRPEIPHPDWVLARVRVAGICGTDLRHWGKHEPELEHHITGHELAGEVVEVGAAVTNVAPGDRVVIESVMGDGECEWCRVQQYNLCPNLYEVRTRCVSRAYGEFVIGPAQKFYKLPDHVSFEEAALIDTFSVCLHAQHRSALSINDKVAIIGAGPIGLGQLMLAKASGADVLITDVVDSALALAKELGADVVLNSGREDPIAAAKAFTGGRGVDIAFECCGGEQMATTLPQATGMARRGGKVVIVGGFDKGVLNMALEWQRIQMSEITLIPSASFAFHGLDAEQGMALELLSKGTLNAKKLITHSFGIDQINEAFETAAKKKETATTFVAITI
ncbi:zinc-dependent alcohol dehydrogenase [Sphingomonas sp. M1-B02]|uniref:zinc-dependent alcohol dehydrogenase n=1 Tax=Sphingomonas sp. M1-B02 TaxID=3114300 RepID=UPI0022403654|nr:zinc-binding dehydrogenase [Sphingomonas sp. S6-11]UZK67977.1 alcohol dehydrogenase catalytic domain-containing protein [Sphingomonas sp. S6-11]